jgi:hypothetical protein
MHAAVALWLPAIDAGFTLNDVKSWRILEIEIYRVKHKKVLSNTQ